MSGQDNLKELVCFTFQVGEHSKFFQQWNRQILCLVDYQNHSPAAGVFPQEEIGERKAQLLFIKTVKRQGKVVQDRLQQTLDGGYVRIGDHGRGKSWLKILGEAVANHRLARTRQARQNRNA